jgi:predicted nucleotidyltransferase
MNIHFTDIVLFEKLKKATMVKVVIGSHMYGTNNVNSDIDYLYIYATSENELLSPFKTHHQLQYKEDGIDHNFVSIHNFIHNTLSGDSTINFEVIHSSALNGTALQWLYENRQMFVTYNIIRSYIGLCRRDINHYGRYKTDQERYKRFGHIIRGVIYTSALLNNAFDFNGCNITAVGEMVKGEFNSGKKLKEITKTTSDLRILVTNACDNNSLNLGKTIKVMDGTYLNEWFIALCLSDMFKSKQSDIMDFSMDSFINSIENWVTY